MCCEIEIWMHEIHPRITLQTNFEHIGTIIRSTQMSSNSQSFLIVIPACSKNWIHLPRHTVC